MRSPQTDNPTELLVRKREEEEEECKDSNVVVVRGGLEESEKVESNAVLLKVSS